MSALDLPTREQEQVLHHRLIGGDKTAHSELAERYYEPLLRFLRERNSSRLTDDLLVDAVYQTWESLCKAPTSYKGTGTLWSFLKRSAQRDLMNLLAKEGRRRRKTNFECPVEQLSDGGIEELDGESPAIVAIRREILPIVEDGLSKTERSFLDLYLRGEKKTVVFAEALGIQELSPAEQKATVKRTKDKLKVRIKRARRDHGDAT